MATVLTPQRPHAAERGRERRCITALLLLALATRRPLLSNAPAAPDSARFLMGLWRWVREGPRVNLTASVHGAIYGDFLSPGYVARPPFAWVAPAGRSVAGLRLAAG